MKKIFINSFVCNPSLTWISIFSPTQLRDLCRYWELFLDQLKVSFASWQVKLGLARVCTASHTVTLVLLMPESVRPRLATCNPVPLTCALHRYCWRVCSVCSMFWKMMAFIHLFLTSTVFITDNQQSWSSLHWDRLVEHFCICQFYLEDKWDIECTPKMSCLCFLDNAQSTEAYLSDYDLSKLVTMSPLFKTLQDIQQSLQNLTKVEPHQHLHTSTETKCKISVQDCRRRKKEDSW